MLIIEDPFWTDWEDFVRSTILHTGFAEFSEIHAETMNDWTNTRVALCSMSASSQVVMLKQLSARMLSQYRQKCLSMAPAATMHGSKQVQRRIKSLFSHYNKLDAETKKLLRLNEKELHMLEQRLENLDLSMLEQYCLSEFKKQCVLYDELFEKPFRSFFFKYPFLQIMALINRSFLEDAISELAAQLIAGKYEAYYNLAFCLGNNNLCPLLSFDAPEDIKFLRKLDQICGRTGSSSNAP